MENVVEIRINECIFVLEMVCDTRFLFSKSINSSLCSASITELTFF